MRRSSSRAMRTRMVCSARASRRAIRGAPLAENSAPPGSSSSGHRSCRCHCSVLLSATRGGPAARGDRPAAADRARARPAAPSATSRCPRPARRGRPRSRRCVGLAALASLSAASRPSAASRRATTRSPRAIRNRSKAPGHVPAVLQRPDPLASRGRAPRRSSAPNPRAPTATVLLAEHLAGRRRDRGDRVRALVCVRTEHDHDPSSTSFHLGCGQPGGHGLLGALPRSYQVTPDIPDRRRATQQKEVRPSPADSLKESQLAAGRDHLLSVGRHRRPESQTASLQPGPAHASNQQRLPGRAPRRVLR